MDVQKCDQTNLSVIMRDRRNYGLCVGDGKERNSEDRRENQKKFEYIVMYCLSSGCPG